MSVPIRISELQRLIDLFRNQLLALDDRVLAILQANWNPSRTRLISLIDLLVADIESGGIVKASDITRLDRAQTLLTQLEAESTRIAAITNQIVPEAQTRASQIAIERARALTVAQAPSAAKAAAIEVQWNSLNTSAVQEATAALADGTPLDQYLKANVEKQVTLVQETLIDGVARGVNAADLGRQIAAQTELPLKSAMTLARDTTMRAYDGATQRSYEANSDVLDGTWTWSASLSSTSCSACIGLHGRVFSVSVSFLPRHSRCRCVRLMNLNDPDGLLPHIETGPEWFARQDAAVQQQIIGSKVGYDGYAAGEVGIEDFVVLNQDDVWGDSYQAGSFVNAQKQARARGFVGTPKPAKPAKPLPPSDGSDLVTVR